MNLYILDKQFNIINILDDYQSLIWTRRYNKPGDFELYLPINEKNIKMTEEEYYVVRDIDMFKIDNDIIYKNVMIFEKKEVIEIRTGNMILISGRDLKSILDKRIIYPTITLSGNISTVCEKLLNECIISPTNLNRKIDNFIFERTEIFNDILIDNQITGYNLLNYIQELTANYEIGFDIKIVNNNYVFYLYKGEDLTSNNEFSNNVIFSKKYENVIKFNYSYDRTNYKNYAIAAGEGENVDRKTIEVGNLEVSGLDRRELFIDARDVQSTDNNGNTIPINTYMQQLKERGEEKLKENTIITVCDSEVEPNTHFILGVDYNLGDIVEVDSESGLIMTPRIVEIIESENYNGFKVVISFQKGI